MPNQDRAGSTLLGLGRERNGGVDVLRSMTTIIGGLTLPNHGIFRTAPLRTLLLMS
jgi:hypothetical protein